MHRWFLLLVLLVASPVWAANTHGTADTQREMQAYFGDAFAGYVHSGCLPSVPGSSLTLAPVACAGYVRGDSGELVYVNQVAQAVGPLNQGDGLYFLAIHRQTGTAMPSWQRQAGSHYVWQKAASPPALAEGLVVAQVTVAGGSITALQDLRIPASYVKSGVYDPTDPLYGGACDGVTQTAAAIQAAITAAPAGAKVSLPAGVCLLNQTLTVTRTLAIEGVGITHTTLRQTVPNIPVLVVGAVNEVGLRKFTVDHTGNPVVGGDGIVFSSIVNNGRMDNVAAMRNWRGFALGCVAYGSISHLETSFNNLHGIEFVYGDCGIMQWQVHHSISTQNKGAGYFGSNTAAANGIGPFLNDAGSFGNDLGGFLFLGSPGHPINDLFLIGAYSSADNNNGIFLDTYGGSHVITNLWSELTGALGGWPVGTDGAIMEPSHTGACVSVTVNNAPGLAITGGYYWNCSWANVSLEAPGSSLTGGASIGAGLALDPNLHRRANIYIGNNGISVTGHRFNYSASGALHYIYLNSIFTDLPLSTNSYDPAIGVENYVKVSPTSSFSGAISPRMVTGINVYSGVPEAAGLTITDMGPGAPTPAKALRVSGGGLEILNYSYASILHRLSDEGTPSWPQRRGQVTISGTNTFASVVLSPTEPDAGYSVQATVVTSSGTPAAGAYTINQTNKVPGGFDISVLTAPGVGSSVTYSWLVHR
jgi:hypothetical protein